jgi:hypothetical protein
LIKVIDRRHHGTVTPQRLPEWRSRAFSALRGHRELAASTPIDEALPDDPIALSSSSLGRYQLRQVLRSL